jgi:hypothetical protein
MKIMRDFIFYHLIFEKLRGDYPLRREFTSFMVDLKGGTEKVRQILETIGFKIRV